MACIAQRRDDKAKLVVLESTVRCVGECGRTFNRGSLIWSYLDNPKDGNYAECQECRYGDKIDARTAMMFT